jgi:hypothetical protein
MNKWKKKAFPHYDDIADLIGRSNANGNGTFRPGRVQNDLSDEEDVREVSTKGSRAGSADSEGENEKPNKDSKRKRVSKDVSVSPRSLLMIPC